MGVENNIGSKIVDHLSGDRKDKPADQLKNWLEASDENKGQFSDYEKIWDATKQISLVESFDQKKAWLKTDQRIKKEKTRKLRLNNIMYSSIGMAASVVLIFAFSFYFGLVSVVENKVEFATENGSRSTIVLPDGSHLILNSGTKVSYQFNKLTKTRQVVFAGEAFFDVTKNGSPFIIKTQDGMQLEVLGTKFNLSAYPEEGYIQTTLVEGSVRLNNNLGDELLLKPGQIAQFVRSTGKLQYSSQQQDQLLGWLDHKIILDHTPLSQLKFKLERRYNVEIVLSPASIGDEFRYTGVFEEETIQDVLGALKEISSIKYNIEGRKVTITKR